MSYKKSLDDKQLIRAIADMVVRNPHHARELLTSVDEITHLYPELETIKSLLDDYNIRYNDNYKDNDFFEKLKYSVSVIPDKDSKTIFNIAINNAEDEDVCHHNFRTIAN